MASAKSEAKKYLGREDDYINLSGLNKERDIANKVYNTNLSSLESEYNNLLNTVASNRNKARTDFTKGRGTVAEDAYLRDRADTSGLAARGLSGGIAQLNNLGNRMETGRQYSNLANTFYNTMNDLDATAKAGENEYNTNRETAQNTLAAALADIGAREANARNAYRAQVAQLAEQIQARRNAAAAAAAALKAQKQANKDNAYNALMTELRNAIGNDRSMTNIGKVADTYSKVIEKYLGGSSKNSAEARNNAMKFMYQNGLYDPNTWTSKPTKSSTPAVTATDILTGGRYYNVDEKGRRIF